MAPLTLAVLYRIEGFFLKQKSTFQLDLRIRVNVTDLKKNT